MEPECNPKDLRLPAPSPSPECLGCRSSGERVEVFEVELKFKNLLSMARYLFRILLFVSAGHRLRCGCLCWRMSRLKGSFALLSVLEPWVFRMILTHWLGDINANLPFTLPFAWLWAHQHLWRDGCTTMVYIVRRDIRIRFLSTCKKKLSSLRCLWSIPFLSSLAEEKDLQQRYQNKIFEYAEVSMIDTFFWAAWRRKEICSSL